MPADQATVFLHRPPNEKPSVLGGGVATVADAERVVLQTAHGRVLVRSVKKEPDGTFTGHVYAVMPREPDVAIGDEVRFSETQVFALKAAEGAATATVDTAAKAEARERGHGPAPGVADDEIAQMARTFEASFRQFDTAASQDEPRAAPASSDASSFDLDIAAVLQDLPPPRATAVNADPARTQPAPKAAAPEEKEKDAALSTAEAMSILRAAEQKGSAARRGPADAVAAEPAPVPVTPKPLAPEPAAASTPPPPPLDSRPAAALTPRTPAANPDVRQTEPMPRATNPVPVPLPTPLAARPVAAAPEPVEAQATSAPLAPLAPPAPDVKITCRECGSTLIVPPAAEDAAAGQTRKVSCRTCGRINEVKV
jgi:hypothetical protein